MKILNRGLLAAVALSTAFTGFTAGSGAHANTAALIAAQLQARTPLCSEFPDFGVRGRVAAYYASSPRSVRMSFVGCFPNFSECESWRREVMRRLNPPVQANRCEDRY
ncbi:MAG: hypothetical protein AAGJ94_07170 [Pseudomonadota bacterium]